MYLFEQKYKNKTGSKMENLTQSLMGDKPSVSTDIRIAYQK